MRKCTGKLFCPSSGKSAPATPCRSAICQALPEKIFFFTEFLIILYCSSSRPTKGALRNVNDAGRDAVDAEGALRRGHLRRTCEVVWAWHPDAGVKFA